MRVALEAPVGVGKRLRFAGDPAHAGPAHGQPRAHEQSTRRPDRERQGEPGNAMRW